MPLEHRFSLAGKKTMVIGAETPAGGAIARAYAEAGADVALCALTADDAVLKARAVKRDIEAMGRTATEYVMDVTLGKNVQVTTRQIAKELGGLDAVASAPDLFLAKPIEKISDSELQRVMQMNFTSQFFVVRTAVEEFRRAKAPGRIVLVTSVLHERGMMNVSAYSAAAGAVASLIRSAGHELSHENITVNGIGLGWMDWMDDRLTPGDENADRARRFPMLRRMGTAEDLGGLAVLLSAEESAPYITGQVLAVDGGLTQHQ